MKEKAGETRPQEPKEEEDLAENCCETKQHKHCRIIGCSNVQISGDLLMRYFSRVLEIDKNKKRTVWEARKQMDISPLRSVMEWRKNVVGAAILAFSSVT